MAINKVSNQVQKHGVLQVVTAYGVDSTATSSASFVDCPNMTVTLNNVRAGSKILIQVDGVMRHYGGAGNFTYGQLLRDGGSMTASTKGLTITNVSSYSPFTMMAYQDNETAGTHTYKLQWRVDAGSCDAYGVPMMVVMEIAQ